MVNIVYFSALGFSTGVLDRTPSFCFCVGPTGGKRAGWSTSLSLDSIEMFCVE